MEKASVNFSGISAAEWHGGGCNSRGACSARAFAENVPKKYSYALWAIVGIRMLFDLPIASGWSLFNLFRLAKKQITNE